MKVWVKWFLVAAIMIILVAAFSKTSVTSYKKSDMANPSFVSASEKENLKVEHLKTPEPLKAIYMTSCIASLPKERSRLVKLIEETELNALVIDVKDYTGVVSFTTGNAEVDKVSDLGKGCRVADMEDFIKELHQKNIYTISRITVFQDPLYTKVYPEVAVKSKKTGGVWRDKKGLAFIDVGAKKYWDHVLSIAKISHSIGFDEINFDYIRFPSDGNMEDADYTLSVGKTKREALKEFFEYLNNELSRKSDQRIITSADIFGMTTTNRDDLGIGQILEYALLNFDYVSPMVYPSHYPPNFNGWKDPNKVTYELIHFVMGSAVSRTNFLFAEISTTTKTIGTTTTSIIPDKFLVNRVNTKQLRPWLQDFDYPVPYSAEMVRNQIKATYDVGLTSWMLWDPSNRYTREALISQNEL